MIIILYIQMYTSYFFYKVEYMFHFPYKSKYFIKIILPYPAFYYIKYFLYNIF